MIQEELRKGFINEDHIDKYYNEAMSNLNLLSNYELIFNTIYYIQLTKFNEIFANILSNSQDSEKYLNKINNLFEILFSQILSSNLEDLNIINKENILNVLNHITQIYVNKKYQNKIDNLEFILETIKSTLDKLDILKENVKLYDAKSNLITIIEEYILNNLKPSENSSESSESEKFILDEELEMYYSDNESDRNDNKLISDIEKFFSNTWMDLLNFDNNLSLNKKQESNDYLNIEDNDYLDKRQNLEDNNYLGKRQNLNDHCLEETEYCFKQLKIDNALLGNLDF
ncbi:MAG: hypothetical protein U1E31_01225 [Rickettsiales bacterium]